MMQSRCPHAEVIALNILPAHAPGTAFYENIKKTNAALEALKLESDPQVRRLDLWNRT